MNTGPERTGRWQELANCRGVDPNLFFPERGEDNRQAKDVCRGCIVREQCLVDALEFEHHGIWGGTSEQERKAIRRTRRGGWELARP